MAAVLTLEEVASYLRVHPATIYRMLKKHEFWPSSSVVIGVSTSNRSTVGVQKPNKRSKSLTAASCQGSSFPFLISA